MNWRTNEEIEMVIVMNYDKFVIGCQPGHIVNHIKVKQGWCYSKKWLLLIHNHNLLLLQLQQLSMQLVHFVKCIQTIGACL